MDFLLNQTQTTGKAKSHFISNRNTQNLGEMCRIYGTWGHGHNWRNGELDDLSGLFQPKQFQDFNPSKALGSQ